MLRECIEVRSRFWILLLLLQCNATQHQSDDEIAIARARELHWKTCAAEEKKVGEKSARSRKCFFFLHRRRQGERIQPNNLFASLILAAANYMQIRKWAIFMSSFVATCCCCQRWDVKEIGLSGLWEKNKEIKTHRFQFNSGCGRSRGSSSVCQQSAQYIFREMQQKTRQIAATNVEWIFKKSFWPKFCNDLLSLPPQQASLQHWKLFSCTIDAQQAIS